MYIRPEQIAEQYEMEVKSISKGRDCFLCETDLGMRALKEYRGSVERAEFLAGMLDFLKGQNIVAEQIFYTKEGEIFARDEEEQNYLLLSVFRGAECDTKSREDMVYAVRLLAGLHNATEQYPDEVPEFVKMNPNALLLLYEKHNRELRQVRNYIRGRKQKNEFEETQIEKTNDNTGTEVTISQIDEVTVAEMSMEALRESLLKEFAWFLFLEKNRELQLKINGEVVNYDPIRGK